MKENEITLSLRKKLIIASPLIALLIFLTIMMPILHIYGFGEAFLLFIGTVVVSDVIRKSFNNRKTERRLYERRNKY